MQKFYKNELELPNVKFTLIDSTDNSKSLF